MRTFLLVLAAIVVGAYAPPATQAMAAPMVPRVADLQPATDLAPHVHKKSTGKKSKKKKKKKSKNKLSVSLREIKTVKFGKEGVEISARVSNYKSDVEYTCRLTVTFADDSKVKADAVELDEEGICVSTIDIPDDEAVVGEARARMEVLDNKEKKVGSDERTFTVRATRA